MNPVYIRIAFYVLSWLVSLIPASWAGWVHYSAETGLLTVSLEGAASALVLALAASVGVLQIWGKK